MEVQGEKGLPWEKYGQRNCRIGSKGSGRDHHVPESRGSRDADAEYDSIRGQNRREVWDTG